MFQMEYAVDFKKAAMKLQKRVETEEVRWENGLCWMLELHGSHCSYYIMSKLLEVARLDDCSYFTENRELFLEFLAYTLTAEDVYEICVDFW